MKYAQMYKFQYLQFFLLHYEQPFLKDGYFKLASK